MTVLYVSHTYNHNYRYFLYGRIMCARVCVCTLLSAVDRQKVAT